MRRRARIPRSVARAIDARAAKLSVINERETVRETGSYFIYCRMAEFNDNSVNCELWVIRKEEYSDDYFENVIRAVDGYAMIHDKQEANKRYFELKEKYSK